LWGIEDDVRAWASPVDILRDVTMVLFDLSAVAQLLFETRDLERAVNSPSDVESWKREFAGLLDDRRCFLIAQTILFGGKFAPLSWTGPSFDPILLANWCQEDEELCEHQASVSKH